MGYGYMWQEEIELEMLEKSMTGYGYMWQEEMAIFLIFLGKGFENSMT